MASFSWDSGTVNTRTSPLQALKNGEVARVLCRYNWLLRTSIQTWEDGSWLKRSCQMVAQGPYFPPSHLQELNRYSTYYVFTWWLIPVSKWDITPGINGISRVNPLIIGVITHLLSGMNHQVHVPLCWWDLMGMYLKNSTRSWTVVHLASLQYRRSCCGEIIQCRPLPRFRLQRIRSIGTSPQHADSELLQNWNITHLFLGKRVWKISVQSIGFPFQDPMLQKIHVSPQWPMAISGGWIPMIYHPFPHSNCRAPGSTPRPPWGHLVHLVHPKASSKNPPRYFGTPAASSNLRFWAVGNRWIETLKQKERSPSRVKQKWREENMEGSRKLERNNKLYDLAKTCNE